jgi:hypothetical protein
MHKAWNERMEAGMHEACFCGWIGNLAEREPAYLGDGDWGLACPRCGRVDRLEWLPAGAREAYLSAARRPPEASAVVGQARAAEPAI